MAGEGRKRQILRVLGIVFGGLLLLVLALPLWLPWVLHPLAQRFGIHYAKYERTGYARFALVDVTWSSSGTQFRAGRVEAFVPTVWLWQRSFGREPTTYVRGANWALELSGN
jgi:hypothetical protein